GWADRCDRLFRRRAFFQGGRDLGGIRANALAILSLDLCPRLEMISIFAAGTLLARKNFIARGPPSCPNRLDKLLRQPFGGHLGSEALAIVGQTDEVTFQTARVVGAKD